MPVVVKKSRWLNAMSSIRSMSVKATEIALENNHNEEGEDEMKVANNSLKLE